MTNNDVLVEVDQVKYRSSGAGRSPIGLIHIYQDRVEWRDNASDDKLIISFSDIRSQRISAPNKSKVQLQLCLHDLNQETFVFVNPTDKEAQINDRELVKETLQQALIHYRQQANRAAAQASRSSKNNEMEAKRKILETNTHLQQLYKHLVTSKLISAQDFWGEYYRSDANSSLDKLGVSNGFLSTIAQSEGANGIKLNLSFETIQSIFKAYPNVERKHLELVPHEMTEQQFWSHFFQSHYFHRQREQNPNPNDPFSDCIKADDKDMYQMVKNRIERKTLDFGYISDDLIANLNVLNNSTSTSKTLLLRRCNYHSSRVLLSSKESEDLNLQLSENSHNGVKPSSVALQVDDKILIDSEELNLNDDDANMEVLQLSEDSIAALQRKKSNISHNIDNFKDIIYELCNQEISTDYDDVEGDCMVDYSSIYQNDFKTKEPEGLSPTDSNALQNFHDSVAELLKHFWMCFPPTTEEMEEKLHRMHGALQNFENNQLLAADGLFGKLNVAHCRHMLKLAKDKYALFIQKRKK